MQNCLPSQSNLHISHKRFVNLITGKLIDNMETVPCSNLTRNQILVPLNKHGHTDSTRKAEMLSEVNN